MSFRLLMILAQIAAPRPVAADSTLGQVTAYVLAAMDEHRREEGTPGIVVALLDRDRTLAVPVSGVADLQSRAPLTADSRFLAGSLSKAFTATALLQLEEEGTVDLRRPITAYLPWFRVRSPLGPITLHHLLTHSAGLPRDRADLPSSPYTALALRDRLVGSVPGEHFAYSNIGYQLLSLVMEEVEGRPFADIIRTRILVPLGLNHTDPAVGQAARLGVVTGYQYLYDDRPPVPGAPLVPSAWSEYSAGDANIVTTAGDLARFLRMLLNQGAGPAGHLIRPASFARMVQRTVPASPLGEGMFYGYGVVLGTIEGDPILWHSGGMPGFRAMIIGDLDEGLGAVVLMNGPGNPRRLGEYALRALIARRRGHSPPPVSEAAPPEVVPGPGDYVGRYLDSAGTSVTIEAEAPGLVLVTDRTRLRLLRQATDEFLIADSAWALFPLHFGRENGRVVELVHGGRWFAGAAYRGPDRVSAPARWSGFTGHYRAQVPYDNNFRVVLRRGRLLLVSPEGHEELLLPTGGDEFRVGGTESAAERVRFEDLVSGRALRVNLSGTDYFRAASP